MGHPSNRRIIGFRSSRRISEGPSTLTLAFRRLTRRLGFTGVRLHDLRHTHATLMMEQGVNPKVVSERLGHASVVITLDTYSHVLPNMQEEAVAKFEAAMAVAEVVQ
ncbi:MAG TPA: hypothetical protein DCL97_08160 [Dehalococcoidia bacterium]|nr:hypothetical protein [Dehalococcoidia bacterium]